MGVIMQTSLSIDLNKAGALTLESVAQLIASVSDRTNTQLRVTKAGLAFISTTHVGSDQKDGLAFRLETFAASGGYVGPDAAKDEKWVGRIFQVLKNNWPVPSDSYIDMF